MYGPYEEPKRLIPTLIVKGLKGELPPLVDPEIARDYVYVEDVIDAFMLCAAHSPLERGAVYNVGTGIQTTLRQVVDTARRLLPITAQPQWGSMANRQWDSTSWVANSCKLQLELGWKPRYDFEAGLAQTIQWFRANQSTLAFYAANY